MYLNIEHQHIHVKTVAKLYSVLQYFQMTMKIYSILLFNLLFLLHLIQHRSFPVYVRFDVWHETRSSYELDI